MGEVRYTALVFGRVMDRKDCAYPADGAPVGLHGLPGAGRWNAEAGMADRKFIAVQGARENNLKSVTLNIPKQQITVFTGVSGSGKSSLVFDTIAAEAQRQLNETFTAFVQGFLPSYGQADVDHIENLNAPVIIDQKRVGGGSRSTMGTYTDISVLLRLLFSRAGQPEAGPAYAFSFNTPQGMCPECEGIGRTVQLDVDKMLDRSLSLNEGAIVHPEFKVGNWMWKMYSLSGLFDNDKPLVDYTGEELHALLYGADLRVSFGEFGTSYEGLVERFTRMYLKKDAAAMSDRSRAIFEQFTTSRVCPACAGARLNEAALACRINGRNIAELSDLEATELITFLAGLTDPLAVKIAERLSERLQHLVDIGLGYLSLNRETATLSGGESQRMKMIRHLGNSLTEMLYILDEPSVGLHARDVARLNGLLEKLRDKGNTVLVVEHDPDVMAIADHIVDIGPGAGTRGGEIVFEGSYQALETSGTLTGRFLTRQQPVRQVVRPPTGQLTVANASLHNLKDVTVDIPTGVLTVVTGMAGSGKSTLINDVFLAQHPDAIVIDQSRVTANRRSAPATYTGMMDDIRKTFAKANKVSASLFSFNSTGSCPNCTGLGMVYTDLAFMEGIASVCEICEGKRFKAEVLAYRLRDKTISDVLDLTVEDALEFFTEKKIKKVLQAMNDVGLGYLKLGQPLSTVSGGEGQRLKLATELHKQGSVYVMDEPTTGLHLSDIGRLMGIIDSLVDSGNTVILIEHHLDVIRQADWIIDLGPEGGSAGGEVLFEGPPQALKESERSITARFI
jgi:excinuclease UvrABC ATPase subunit